MASVWGIDIGKAALKAVKLRRTSDGLEIQAIEYVPYPIEEDEDDRQEQVNGAIRSFMTKHRLGAGDEIVVGIPGLHAFSRFITMPATDRARFNDMVRMEAQQQIPFDISEVNWDFTRIEKLAPAKKKAKGDEEEDDEEEPSSDEVDVGIFACRSELIDGFLTDLRENNLRPSIVTIAPLAIYNFVRYNQDLSQPGATVILDIGAEHTNLVIADKDRFWLRNLRIAGNDITKALAERFKIPFAEAEKLKASAAKSDQAKKIFSSMEQILKDLIGEIHRSVGFFKSQAPELDVQRMILLGDATKLKNLSKFLETELKYEVTKVARLEEGKFVLDPDVDLDLLKNHLLGFGVALGLAIQGVGRAACSINLAPKQLQVQAKLKGKLYWAIGTAACSWLALGLAYQTWAGNRDKLKETNEKLKGVGRYQTAMTEAAQAKEQLAPLATVADPYLKLGADRLLLLKFLEQLKDVLPSANGTIPSLGAEQRKQPLANQIQAYKELLQKDQTWKNKLWLLDMQIQEKTAQTKDAKEKEEGPYFHVVLRVAKHNAEPAKQGSGSALRDDIEANFANRLRDLLKAKPFWVRKKGWKPDSRPEEYYGKVEVGVADARFHLHPDMTSEAGKHIFDVAMITISFDIGAKPPEPKAAPAEGQPQQPGGN